MVDPARSKLTATVIAPKAAVGADQLRSVITRIRPILRLIATEQRDVLLAFAVALLMNVALWVMRRVWFPFNPSIAWSGSLVLGLNAVLALIFARKGHVFVQALAVTGVVVELLLLILIVRTGTAGV